MSKPPLWTSTALFVLALASLVLAVAGTAAPHPNLEKALAAQTELADQRPGDGTVYNDLGNLLLLAERVDEAESAYRQAVELDPGLSSARFNLALLLQQDERTDEAADELKTLLELDPGHAWAHYQLGVILAEKGQRKEAIDRYARAFALDPDLTFARHNPHIIDNDLSTEALLRSNRYREAQSTRVPRQYGEADRIAELMLEQGDEPGGDAEAAPAGEETGGDEAGEGGTISVDPSPRASFDDGEESRVLTHDDLDPGSDLGQVKGGGSRVRGGRSSTRYRPPSGLRVTQPGQQQQRPSPRYRPPAARTPPPQGEPPVFVAPGDRQEEAERQRYRPSRRSSAQLELELLPADDAGADAAATIAG